ncbi:MAG: guanylate kinase [Desulfovibrio sp.]
MALDRLGLVLVICAPSGTGKSTVIQKLLADFPRFEFSISWTTRAPRGEEEHGKDYFFVSREDFIEKKDAGFFAEWAEVHGNFYGTPYKPVHDMLNEGKDVLFDIDVQGAMQLQESFPEGLFVFLLPPSRTELEARLRGRGTDAEEDIVKRLDNALGEIEAAKEFNYWIINGDLEKAYEELRAVYVSGRTKPANQPLLLNRLISTWK